MTNEIKEILDDWKKFLSWCYENNDKTIEIHRDNVKKILDYITNLQEEIARLNKIIDEIEKIVFDKNLYETEYEGIYKCIKGELCDRYYLLTELRKKIRKLKKELKEEGK